MNKPIKQSNPRNIVSASPTCVGVVQNLCQAQGGNRSGVDFCRSALPANRGLFYDGGWHEAESGRHIAVENPSTGESLGEIADGDAADIAAVVASAKKGFWLWRDVYPLEPGAIFRQIAENVPPKAHEHAANTPIDLGDAFYSVIH